VKSGAGVGCGAMEGGGTVDALIVEAAEAAATVDNNKARRMTIIHSRRMDAGLQQGVCDFEGGGGGGGTKKCQTSAE
jgi:hypothetical protein